MRVLEFGAITLRWNEKTSMASAHLKWNGFHVEVLLMATWHCAWSYLLGPEHTHIYTSVYGPLSVCWLSHGHHIIQVVHQNSHATKHIHSALFRENIIISKLVKSKLVLFSVLVPFFFAVKRQTKAQHQGFYIGPAV